ncbi:hypothetical protein KMT30_19950 [Streptomyces sp. IBSBF 2953]|uniref:hypothetical protein n=1 Tax=Streptomyces TaxID=1883 RepID=UPI00211A033C|nr:hypothetical protein [Streptomyces scabiei]MCQ9181276.1 hypothetical protein [Streptomyces hayashii]MDX3114135.1 hypothetical protein [Streptomyces scabiei]
MWLPARLRSGIDDIRRGRRLDTYATFLIGLAVTGLGLSGVVDATVVGSTVLAGVSFLVLHTVPQQPLHDTESVLRDRSDYRTVAELLRHARDLRVYGPTALHVLVNSAEIRREILDRGGSCRVVVQAPDPGQLRMTALQLDSSMDLEVTLRQSLSVLRRLADRPGFAHRLLPFNPGFSLLVVNADAPDGYVIVETHGFQDDSIADRMHIQIAKAESSRWFGYWTARFEALWEAAAEDPGAAHGPTPDGTDPTAVPIPADPQGTPAGGGPA